MTDSNGQKTNTNGSGRAPGGRFAKGNPGGPGRPAGRLAVEQWRKAFDQAVSAADIAAVVRKLVKAARDGQQWAIREMLDRCIGNPVERDNAARLDEFESLFSERLKR